MTQEWSNARNPASPKLAAASNIPNDNSRHTADHSEAIGSTHQAAGRFTLARRNYERWYRLTRDLEAALRLGDVCRQLEDFKTALAWYRLAHRTAVTQNRLQEKFDAGMGLAMCTRGLENFPLAIRQLKSCATHYRKSRDREGFAYALWALGTTQRFAGRLKAAERNLRRSIALYEKLRDKSGLAYARCGLGGTLRMRGRFIESLALYQKAHNVLKKLKDRFGEAYSNCGQGNALRMQGKINQAFPFMERAEILYRKLGQKGPLGFVLWSRAQAEISLQKFTKASKHLVESRRIFKSVNDGRGLVYCDLGEGQLHACRGDGRHKQFFRRAMKNSRRLNLAFEEVQARRRLRLEKSPCKIIEIP